MKINELRKNMWSQQEDTEQSASFRTTTLSACSPQVRVASVFSCVACLLFFWNASADTHYVDVNSTNPVAPYTSWATAAGVIQDAVDAAAPGDQVLVTSGVYATGGRAVYGTMTNRVAVDKPLSLLSVNGPDVTIIEGYQVPGTTNGDGAIRCAYLTNGASLSGFTLTNGATRDVFDTPTFRESTGGGVWCESTNAVVLGCVLAGNAAMGGGGAAWGMLSNSTMVGNSAYAGGGAYESTLHDCVLTDNSVINFGGGASYSTLNNCTLSGNSAPDGGGANDSTLNNCTLSGNSAQDGGGAIWSALNNCTLTGNSAADGGGVNECTVNNCSLSSNIGTRGGGAWDSTLNNCTLTSNSASDSGGGTSYGTVNNSIVYFNTAPNGPNHFSDTMNYSCSTPLPLGSGNISDEPGLASSSHLGEDSPCIGAGSSAYSTGTDIGGQPWASPPSMGCDEFTAEALTRPLSVGIAASYTNVAAGFLVELTALVQGPASVNVWDYGDGSTATNWLQTSHGWGTPGDYDVVVRAYNDSNPGGISATVTVHVVTPTVHYVAAGGANPVSPYTSWETAATTIQDAVDAAGTFPGTVVLVTNGVYATGGRAVLGAMTNRVAVDKLLSLKSVNGPSLTIIQGYQVPGTTNGDGAVRCVYLTNGASLSGFILTNGATRTSGDWKEENGGGVRCESVSALISNCVFVGNSAGSGGGAAYSGTLSTCMLTGNSAARGGGSYGGILSSCDLIGNRGAWGGGIYQGTLNHCMVISNSSSSPGGGGASRSTLNNCILRGNSATAGNGHGGGARDSRLNNCALTGNTAWGGGGAFSSTLNNCNLVGNTATGHSAGGGGGGGARFGTLNNCVVYFNTSADGENYSSATFNYSCTAPLPTNGIGNLDFDPLFVDTNGWTDLRLQSNSPCINSGNNAYVTSTVDLDGNPRIVGGTVDMGAYEYQTPASVISYAWLQQYGLPTDGSADHTDSDSDSHTTYQEWKAWTIPTNGLSVLKLLTPQPQTNDTVVTWQSVAGHSYSLERATNANGAYSLLQDNIPGQAGTTSFTDTNAAAAMLYRVSVPE